MAINPESRYPGQVNGSSGSYPLGSARNVSAPGADDGTPFEQAFVNDIWGMLQSLLAGAGITPSGSPDAVGASDYFDAMQALFGYSTTVVTLGGNFSGSNNLRCSRMGNIVTLTAVGVLSHSSGNEPVSGAGVIPDLYRPDGTTSNIYFTDATQVSGITVDANGLLALYYWTPAGGTVNKTNSTTVPSITFAVAP